MRDEAHHHCRVRRDPKRHRVRATIDQAEEAEVKIVRQLRGSPGEQQVRDGQENGQSMPSCGIIVPMKSASVSAYLTDFLFAYAPKGTKV